MICIQLLPLIKNELNGIIDLELQKSRTFIYFKLGSILSHTFLSLRILCGGIEEHRNII